MEREKSETGPLVEREGGTVRGPSEGRDDRSPTPSGEWGSLGGDRVPGWSPLSPGLGLFSQGFLHKMNREGREAAWSGSWGCALLGAGSWVEVSAER